VQRDGKFHLLEATIDGIHSALQKREITCDALIRLYFKRIKTYRGHCVKYDKNGDGISPDYDLFMPSGKGVYLGVVSVIPNAGKANAIQSVNLRPANGFNKLKVVYWNKSIMYCWESRVQTSGRLLSYDC
jgi:hypothetical protein